MEYSKRGYIPMTHGITLSKSMCPKTQDGRTHMSLVSYASAIGSIMYVMLCTRTNVSYALSVTSKYQSDPGEGHWVVVKNILKYLRKTKDLFLIYADSDLIVRRYTNASFQFDRDDFKSQSGYVFTLNGGVVSFQTGYDCGFHNWIIVHCSY